MSTTIESLYSPELQLSKSPVINDFSLPRQSSSPSYSSNFVQMHDDLGTPASRLRAILNRVPNYSSQTASSPKNPANNDENISKEGSELASSVAQESVRDLFRSLRDTPEKPTIPQRRGSIDFSGIEHSSITQSAQIRYSDEAASLDTTSPSFNGSFIHLTVDSITLRS